MGDKGSADNSGMMEAMASAQAANQAYALGEQQFQWSQQVWNQEQPLVDQSEQQQISLSQQEQASLAQSQAESQAQWAEYEQTYAPLEQSYAEQAQNWASPQAIAEARGQAMSDVGEQGTAGINTAAEQLRAYGVNPSSPRYAALYTSAQPMIGAAEAAAGTTAAQNLRMQQMELESGAINTGRGLVNATGSLTEAGTGAAGQSLSGASGAAGTAFGNLTGTGVGAGATSSLFNAGTNAMNSYVGAVNGYNQSQAEFAQAGASEMGGFGSALGSLAGLGFMGMRSDERDKTDIHREGTSREGLPLYSFRYKEDPKSYPKVVGPMAQDVAKLMPHKVGAIPGSPKGTLAIRFADGGGVMVGSDPQLTPDQGGGATGIPASPMPPAQIPPGGTPGGGVPAHASPSMGVQTDDVPAMLTANEFVIPKDVATWKGHEYFAKQIDQARTQQQKFSQRGDIGGEPTQAIPQRPTFVSRPQGMPQGAIPGMPA